MSKIHIFLAENLTSLGKAEDKVTRLSWPTGKSNIPNMDTQLNKVQWCQSWPICLNTETWEFNESSM